MLTAFLRYLLPFESISWHQYMFKLDGPHHVGEHRYEKPALQQECPLLLGLPIIVTQLV